MRLLLPLLTIFIILVNSSGVCLAAPKKKTTTIKSPIKVTLKIGKLATIKF